MDIFYVVGTGSKWNNNELKYSLRSLEQFGKNIDNVYIVGHKPSFVNDNVKWISVSDIGYPSVNHWYKVRKFFMETNIENAVYMMDDVFFTKEVDFNNYPFYQKGQLKYYPKPNNYRTSINNTKHVLEGLGKPITNFEVHCPITYERDKFLNMTAMFDKYRKAFRQFIQVRSLYCNYNGITGTFTPDVKIFGKDMGKKLSKMNILDCFSISNDSIKRGMGSILEKKYPNKSKWEK